MTGHIGTKTPHLSQRDDEAAQRLFLAGEADVVGGDKHLSQDVHLVKGCPQGAARVSVQFFVFGQAEECPVALALCSGIQIPTGWETSCECHVNEGAMVNVIMRSCKYN